VIEVGLDIGYLKTAIKAEGKIIIFPSYYRSWEPSLLKLPFYATVESPFGGYERAMEIHIEGLGDFAVGWLALLQDGVNIPLIAKSFSFSRERVLPLFLGGMIELLPSGGELSITTALPIRWLSEEEKLTSILTGEHKVSRIGTKEMAVFNVKNVRVFPQPLGALATFILDDKGKARNTVLLNSTVLVVDIGGRTTQSILVKSLTSSRARCFQLDLALIDAYSEIVRDLENQFGLTDYNPYSIWPVIVKRSVKVKGKPVSIQRILDSRLSFLAARIIDFLHSHYGELADVDYLIFTGGGSSALKPYLRAHFRDKEWCQFLPNPIMANVEGYYRLGLFLSEG